jgi:hypothetical protein
MIESTPVRSPGELTDPEFEYRSVDPWAVGGLVLAILSPMALIAPLLWLIPPLGILANSMALRRLRTEPHRIGRTAALVGLGLSVLFGAAPMARALTARILLADQARPTADQFFEYLCQGQPEKAAMLESAPESRQPLDESLWPFYRRNKDAQDRLRKLTENRPARALLALGDRAQVRFYKMPKLESAAAHAAVLYWYTVTYDDENGKKKTFLIRILLERKPSRTAEINPWQVTAFSGGIDPDKIRY